MELNEKLQRLNFATIGQYRAVITDKKTIYWWFVIFLSMPLSVNTMDSQNYHELPELANLMLLRVLQETRNGKFPFKFDHNE